MDNNHIKHNQPLITADDLKAVENVLISNWIAQGPQVAELEATFSRNYGGFSCGVSNGTSALYLALHALGANSSSHIALPTYACSALLNAVYLIGANPILVDVLDDSFCIDPIQVDKYASGADFAIGVHTFGAIADLRALKGSTKYVIEDCCQSLGAPSLTTMLGQNSHAAVFSFYATKLIAGGQGGLIWSKSQPLLSKIHDYRQFDCRDSYIPRFNFQMNDINAALINSQLERIESNCARRRLIADQYSQHLHSSLTIQSGPCRADGIPYRYVVRLPDCETRNSLLSHMKSNNVECTIPIQRYELLHRYLNLDSKLFPVAEHIVDTTLSLPIHPGLTDNQVDFITGLLSSFKI